MEIPINRPTVQPETAVSSEMLAAEITADDTLAELTAAVDAAYAEGGLEDSLERIGQWKAIGPGDGIGYESGR